MEKTLFGTLKTGESVYKYTLKNESATLTLMTFGAAITSFEVFGKDIIGGYDRLEDYLSDDSHQGAIIGRVANRVAGAKFEMDGKIYTLPANDGKNCLHGGCGFDRKVWEVENASDDEITFKYTSPDMEEGFPGEVDVSVTYRLFGTAFSISYTAIPKAKTPISLTNHSYFNLNGFDGDVLNHSIKIFASAYTQVDQELIPTGEHPELDGAFDLRTPTLLGDRINDKFGGYDHNYVIKTNIFKEFYGVRLGLCAKLSTDELTMKVYTDQPGIQFYTGNFLCGEPNFKNNVTRVKHGALCLETQTEPNSINSGIGFYDAGEVYTHNTVYSVEKKNN